MVLSLNVVLSSFGGYGREVLKKRGVGQERSFSDHQINQHPHLSCRNQFGTENIHWESITFMAVEFCCGRNTSELSLKTLVNYWNDRGAFSL